MKKHNLALITCPNCGSDSLDIKIYNSIDQDIIEGCIQCVSCKVWYRIENSIADLLPLSLRRDDLYNKFAKKYDIILDSLGQRQDTSSQKVSQINFFKEKFDEYEKNVVNSKYYKTLDEVVFINWIKNNFKPGDTILDIGCGTGRQSIPFAQQGINVIGLDASEEMLLMAKEKVNSLGLEKFTDLFVADAINPPFKNNIFNACVLYGTLHHLPDKHIAIAKASEKLKPDGYFYSLDPNDSPLRFIFDFLMKIWKLYDDEASNDPLLSKKELTEWLGAAGINNEIKYSTYLPPHMFYLLSSRVNFKLLKITDYIFNKLPLINTFGGVIIAEGRKA